jgi:O-antigen/teichoic acid export membrane protein
VTALIGPLLVLAGFGLYMATNTRYGRFRRIPWEFLAISALGALVGVAIAFARDGAGSWVAAAVGVIGFAFLVWFFFAFTMYGVREDRPRVGDRFPALRLPTSDGRVFDLAAERGRRHLLVFYRGSW